MPRRKFPDMLPRPPGTKRRNIVTIKVDDYELKAMDFYAKQLGASRAEFVRSLLFMMDTLYSEDLKLKNAVNPHKVTITKGGNLKLYEALKPIPALMHEIRRPWLREAYTQGKI